MPTVVRAATRMPYLREGLKPVNVKELSPFPVAGAVTVEVQGNDPKNTDEASSIVIFEVPKDAISTRYEVMDRPPSSCGHLHVS